MSRIRIEEQLARARGLRAKPQRRDVRDAIQWQTIDLQLENDTLFGGKDWNELAVLLDQGTLLGRAVAQAQKYFSDEEIVDALKGESREVTLTLIDGGPAFVNAAMLAEALAGRPLETAAG